MALPVIILQEFQPQSHRALPVTVTVINLLILPLKNLLALPVKVLATNRHTSLLMSLHLILVTVLAMNLA